MYYEEDHFHPSERNEHDNNSLNFRDKDILNNLKSLDKGYNRVQRKLNQIWTDGKFYKNITFEFYTSSDIGCKIRNAVTGFRTNYKVGSTDEDLFFKVKIVDGNCKKGSGHLFYDSPEQYEKHQFCIVSTPTKELWHKKHMKQLVKV
jgi:hypothetical protein